MRCPVRITFKGDRRYGNHRTFRKPLFQIVIFRFTLGDADPPAIIMDRDGNMVRVVELSKS